MGVNNLNKELEENYQIFIGNSHSERAPILEWKRMKDTSDRENFTVREVDGYIEGIKNSRFWELRREDVDEAETIYTFGSVPEPGSLAAKDPDYKRRYLHIRIRQGSLL